MKHKKNTKIVEGREIMCKLLMGSALAVLAIASAPAFAQQTDGVEVDASELEIITVTARRVSENLQDSPVAISAFGENAIRERAINNVSDIGKFTPSLSFDSAAAASGSSDSVTVFLRGIGQTDFNMTVDPGVGIYLDGVYISRSVGALLETRDVESIQVLRGPQGTLFGKNTIGGALIVTSRRPDEQLGGNIEATTGSYNRIDVGARINVPVSEDFRFYVSGLALTRDGYVERLVDGQKKGNQNSYSGRFVAEWDATPDFNLLLSADYTRTRERAVATTLLDVNENAIFPLFHNVFLNAPGCLPPSPTSNPSCYNAQWLTGDKDKTNESGPNRSVSDVWGVSLNASWDAGPVTIKSITAYRELDSAFAVDIDQSPLAIQRTENDYTQNQFSQEFQLQGDGFGEKLNYTLGLYYQHEGGTDINSLFTAPTDFRSGGSVKNDSYAAFAQFIFHATDNLNLTLGGRYTSEDKRFSPDQEVLRVHPAAQAPLPPGFPTPFFLTNPVTSMAAGSPQPLRVGDIVLPAVQRTTSANEFTPSVTLDYKFTPDMLGYFTFSRGFKSGGFTQRVFPPEPEAPAFEPEFARVLEIGVKVELFNRHLRLNSALFDTKYSDLQIIVNDGFAPKVRNAGKARIRGFESEAQLVVTDAFRLTGAVSYLDAEYREVDARAAPVTVDSALANTPKWTANAGITVEPYDGEAGRVVLQGDWSYRSATYKDAINTPSLKQDGYSVFNMSATFDAAQGWSVTGGITNLTDKRYIISGYSDLNFIGSTYGVYSRPREWYLKLGYSF